MQQSERGECLDETYEEVLRVVYDWIASKDRTLPLCWLSGSDADKSAIAISVAKAFEGKGLAASFLFSSSDPKRNNPFALALTISHGLVVNMPFARTFINQRISDDPTILKANLEDQFRELVFKPSLRGRWWRRSLAKLSSAFREPDLVVIDGLDECGDEKTQRRILSTILDSYQQTPRPPLRFLICSRPEAWIQEAFDAKELRHLTERVALDDSFMPDRDIKRYYLHQFQLIRTDPQYAHVQFPTPWPSPEDLESLVQKSSGYFVHAAITARFIKLAHPIAQLRSLLDSYCELSFSPLDRLYHTILSTSPNHERLLSILAAIFILPPHAPPSPGFTGLLLGLSTGEVDLSLRPMHSVLNIRGSDVAITAYHTSFSDFLHDPLRSGKFYIDQVDHHRHALVLQWLKTLAQMLTVDPNIVLHPNTANLDANIRHLLGGWVSLCVTDKQCTTELLAEFFRCIFSAFPDQNKLLATLSSLILLPTHTSDRRELQGLNDLISGSDTVHVSSTMKLLEICRLATPADGTELDPFLLTFLCDPSQEYYIDIPKYRELLARRWIQALVPRNQPPSSSPRPDWGLRTLWSVWANFCRGVERPSDELLSDLENLDLMAVAISMALIHPEHKQYLSMVIRPLEAIISWLMQVEGPVPARLIECFKEAINRFEHHLSEESTLEHRPTKPRYHQLDRLYTMIIQSANPNHDKIRLLLAVTLVPFPEYLELSSGCLELLLGLSSEELDPTLRSMRSVLNIRSPGDDLRVHASFREFLVDPTRSHDFYVNLDTQKLKHAIARQWLQDLTTSKVLSYSFDQLFDEKTRSFFTNWIGLCLTILKPTRDLLEDLYNVDLACVFLCHSTSSHNFQFWGDTFKALVPWVETYASEDHSRGGRKQRDVLVKGLVHKFRNRPVYFHLEWPAGSPQDSQVVHRVIHYTARCRYRNGLATSRHSALQQLPRLTECHCDLSEGNELCDPGHLAYQEACLQMVKAFVSRFEMLTQGSARDHQSESGELTAIFGNLMESLLLQHCRLDTELLLLCRIFLQLAKRCPFMGVYHVEGERQRTNMLNWVKTFSDRFAEEAEDLEVRASALPWELWASADPD
ncbi:hypothetical protein PQX77_014818 [Marasmius sp. AFHP31]|nr:hypothetical protein PQX77_014818 [Marasmius sp. AFHP31]